MIDREGRNVGNRWNYTTSNYSVCEWISNSRILAWPNGFFYVAAQNTTFDNEVPASERRLIQAQLEESPLGSPIHVGDGQN